jgi:hypothetical protein
MTINDSRRLFLCAGQRVYCCSGGSTFFEFFTNMQTGPDQIVRIRAEGDRTFYKVSHMMRPFNGTGLELVEQECQMSLPDDVKSFYNRWSGGALVYRQVFRLLTPQQIVNVTTEIRTTRDEDDLPHQLLRFCDMEDSNYFALRKDPAAPDQWNVIFADIGYTDADMQGDEGKGMITDHSFTDWLARLNQTDGFPSVPGMEEFEPDPACVRVA